MKRKAALRALVKAAVNWRAALKHLKEQTEEDKNKEEMQIDIDELNEAIKTISRLA